MTLPQAQNLPRVYTYLNGIIVAMQSYVMENLQKQPSLRDTEVVLKHYTNQPLEKKVGERQINFKDYCHVNIGEC